MPALATRSLSVASTLILAALFLLLPSEEVGGQTVQTLVERGHELYIASCASCHGVVGTGTPNGPSLIGVGAASADFQLRTGRMPLDDPDDQATRKAPAFSPVDIAALVAYVAFLGDGPEIPDVDLAGADVSNGQKLFVANCAPCHGATGNGGAAGPGALAPSLYRSAPLDIAEAMITGPGEMPVFALGEDERDDVIAFIRYLQEEPAPGGADIGGIGPVPEGFVGWAVGITALTLVCVALGSRRRGRGGPGEA